MLIGFLGLPLLHAQMRVNPIWECHGAEALTADQMIARLNSGMDTQDHDSAKCICSYSESLARAEDLRSLPALARYIDLRDPLTDAEISRHQSDLRFDPFGNKYPVQEAFLQFRQLAYPVLVQTIQSETTFNQRSENALEALMWMGAVYPDRTIKMLIDAAAKTNGKEAKMLLVAASKAVTMWECERVRPVCENVAIPKQNTAP